LEKDKRERIIMFLILLIGIYLLFIVIMGLILFQIIFDKVQLSTLDRYLVLFTELFHYILLPSCALVFVLKILIRKISGELFVNYIITATWDENESLKHWCKKIIFIIFSVFFPYILYLTITMISFGKDLEFSKGKYFAYLDLSFGIISSPVIIGMLCVLIHSLFSQYLFLKQACENPEKYLPENMEDPDIFSTPSFRFVRQTGHTGTFLCIFWTSLFSISFTVEEFQTDLKLEVDMLAFVYIVALSSIGGILAIGIFLVNYKADDFKERLKQYLTNPVSTDLDRYNMWLSTNPGHVKFFRFIPKFSIPIAVVTTNLFAIFVSHLDRTLS